ncbi:unnamed protein product [Prorocentrum cordatum]|uniref:Uncharacterized protein n=1 Tax=Prorocentrum cordatum TaxID=2364126 RepID=A0ABN9Y4F1_9DINO|nr:unnamed protein product [Polarella glacialis]
MHRSRARDGDGPGRWTRIDLVARRLVRGPEPGCRKGCCDMFAGCCKSCGECWEPIVNNPLGNYVVGTWVAMAVAAAASGWAIGQLGDCDSDIKGKLALFCIANFALAFIHSGMAYYMQRQIIKGLGGKDYAQMTAKEIQSQAGQVLLYDVPVCLYSFLATAAFGMQCSDGARTRTKPLQSVPERSQSVPGRSEKAAAPETSSMAAGSQRFPIYPRPILSLSWLRLRCWGLTLGSCGGNEPHGGAAALMITWAVLAFAYLFCWYCCQCCQGTVSKKQTAAGGPPVTVGAQSA